VATYSYFNGTDFVFLSVNRRNNEERVWASLFRRFMDTNVYGTVSVKI